MYNPYAVGKNVYLRQATLEDAEGKWHEWLSDEETTKWMLRRFWPNSKEGQLAFAESLKNDREKMILSIIDREEDKHIGVGSISSINWVHRFCEMAIIVGEKEYRKGAVSYESWALMLKIAFLRLNMQSVLGGYIESNIHTKQILEVAGFKTVGRYEGLCTIDAKPDDVVMVMLRRSDWMLRNGFGEEEQTA
jgi:[ribosomal protein S5]-alanine N-acetyltransferase